MRVLVIVMGLSVICPLIGRAEPIGAARKCDGIDVAVTAPDQGISDLVCGVAIDQADRLAHCGIRQSRPLSIAIVPGIEGLPGNCVGAFHCATDEVEVVLPETFAEWDAPDFIYRGLSPEAAFASVLRHELTHALLEHTTEEAPINRAAHEYIASAFQIDAMTEEERATFLAVNGQRPVKSLETLNMFIYGFLPGRFATAAWLHFSAPGNGCAFVEEVISGQVIIGAPNLSPP